MSNCMEVILLSTGSKQNKKIKHNLFPAGFEPATLRVWSARDNHYTTETGMWERHQLFDMASQAPQAQWRNG